MREAERSPADILQTQRSESAGTTAGSCHTLTPYSFAEAKQAARQIAEQSVADMDRALSMLTPPPHHQRTCYPTCQATRPTLHLPHHLASGGRYSSMPSGATLAMPLGKWS